MSMAALPKSTAQTPPPAAAKGAPYEAGEGSWVPQPLLALTPESQLLSVSQSG
jgi:hypothetical protein